jgi:DNA-binding FadR family transcriptional regulator
MAPRTKTHEGAGDRRSLVEDLAAKLRASIFSGEAPVGSKLPSESALTGKYGISRTVVREAVAALRSDGLVEPRQGAGVFVIGNQARSALPFEDIDTEKLSNIVEMMELRIAVESEAAALAAARRSPAQEAKILEALDELDRAAAQERATGPLDLEFHLTIARATNNPRFVKFLEMLGRNAIPRARMVARNDADTSGSYYAQLSAEHRRIAAAISAQDQAEARLAMHDHLEGGMRRYQDLRHRSAKLV